MKKKTKFRLKNDLAIPFWIAILLCLIGAATNSLLFRNSFFRALEKLNEEPIARITFKYKTAQRKFIERVVWDRLRQNSPVYNGDTIHTAELSEATIWFLDGTTLDLAENTMAQVFLHTDGSLAADLSEGVATVDSSENSQGLTLTAGNIQLAIQSGTKIAAQKTSGDENVSLSVQRGLASLGDGREIGAGNSFSVGKDGSTQPLLSVISPLPSSKIIYYDEGECEIPFEWNSSKEGMPLELTLATDKNFENIAKITKIQDAKSAKVSLPKGIYYWKLAPSEKGESAETCKGKLQVIQALKPELLAPVSDYAYNYRRHTPSIRFIWTESESATAYNFAVSKSRDMSNPIINQRNSSSSSIISTLGEGTYYWQVTPYYVVNRIGLANPSEIRSFKIEQRGELTAPHLYIPGEGDFVNKSKQNFTLSWGMESEATSYKVTVSQNQNLSSPVFSKETSENYVTLHGSDVASLKNGQYYWGVTQLDSEGNESPRSIVRSFYILDGKFEHRTVFPPNNYELWKPLVSDTRFTWKTNLNFTQHIQIASDSDFNKIVFDSEASSTSFTGAVLNEGTYWWRVVMNEGTFTSNTPGKLLYVVPELPEPALILPTESRKAIVRPAENFTFKWQGSEKADYYRIKLYKGNGETPVYDENFISGTDFSLSMDNYTEGSYRWELQSYAYETESSSRRSSRLASANFVLRKIRPVTLLSPESGIVFDGMEAIDNPPVIVWQSPESFSKAELVLRKINGKKSAEKVVASPSFKHQLEPLAAGTYEWTVKALTTDEIDISAMKPFTFTVKEIPPFDPPKNARTEGGSVFDAKYLRKTPYIVFSWEKVPKASDYILEIYKKRKLAHKEVLRGNTSTSFKLENLADLSKGDFDYSVKAVRLNRDGSEILIDGESSKGSFKIDYSLNEKGAKRKKTGDFYGR